MFGSHTIVLLFLFPASKVRIILRLLSFVYLIVHLCIYLCIYIYGKDDFTKRHQRTYAIQIEFNWNIGMNKFIFKQISYVCVCINITFPYALDVNTVFHEMLLAVSTSPGQCVIFLIFGPRAFVLGPGIHFTHNLWNYSGNLVKSIIALIFTLTMQSSNILANGTTA